MNTSLGANLFSNTNITISSLALFLNFRKKAGNFHILLKFLIHLDAKNKTHFTSNLTPISMSLFLEPRNKKKWLKTCKNQTVYRNKTYIYVIRCLGKSQGSAVKLKAGLVLHIMIRSYLQIQNNLKLSTKRTKIAQIITPFAQSNPISAVSSNIHHDLRCTPYLLFLLAKWLLLTAPFNLLSFSHFINFCNPHLLYKLSVLTL